MRITIYFPGGYFTKDQYDQVLKMMMPRPNESCKANVASSMHVCDKINDNEFRWIIDSGVAHHITYCTNILNECRKLSKLQNNKVQVPTRNTIRVEHIGNVVIMGNCKLNNVLHVSNFRFNLLSVSKLTKDLNFLASFYPGMCVMQALVTEEVIGIEKEKNSLYILKHETLSIAENIITE